MATRSNFRSKCNDDNESEEREREGEAAQLGWRLHWDVLRAAALREYVWGACVCARVPTAVICIQNGA